MTQTWNDFTNGERWRGVVAFIRHWVGPFDSDQGMRPEDLEAILRSKSLNLAAAVREWCLLAANWTQGGLNVWIHPQELVACNGIVWILTDTEGINQWGVRFEDVDTDDPPVVSCENDTKIACPTFSKFVTAMVVNDVLFDPEAELPVELDHDAAFTDWMCPVSSCYGDFFADGPLETATIVIFAYPHNGPVCGRSRTPAGHALLQRLR